MARDDSQLDKETLDRVLAEELAKGTDRRIAEGRARSAALKAYRKAHGIEPEGVAGNSVGVRGDQVSVAT